MRGAGLARQVDVLTHALLPYGAALLALGLHRRAPGEDRRRLALALAFGLAGAAPDFDALVSWAPRLWDGAYWLQHRGVSHSLVGSALFGVLALLAASGLARAWPRMFGLFRWRAAFLPLAVLGAWTHLLLDCVTLSGIPLLWPFAWGRASLEIYHWLVPWLFPISGAILLMQWRGWLRPPGVVRGAAIVLAVLVVLGGVRLATRPHLAEGETAFPRPSELEWTVVAARPDGSYEAHLVRMGHTLDATPFKSFVAPGAGPAVALAQRHDAFKGWRMESYGPIVVTATPAQGGWNVTFTDVAARFEAQHDPTWTPARPIEAWGVVSFHVEENDITVAQRGW